MHRAMMQSIQAVFPQMEPLFSAWAQVPQNPDDPLEPMPNNGEPRAFDPDKLAALNRINSDLSGFQSEDELGLFLQTSRRPQLGNPLALSPDPEAGLHNYLHLRLGYPITDPTNFEFGMRNHNQNFKNERFWRLHGWIDRVWAEYRRLKGITSYNDPGHETGHDMLLHRHHPLMHHHHPLIVQPLPLIDAFAMEVTSQPRMVRHLL
jgi:hypothetical protein